MALTLENLDIESYRTNFVTHPSKNEYFHAVRSVEGEPMKKTLKRVVGTGYSNKGYEFGDSGDVWYIICTSRGLLNLREAVNDSITEMPVHPADESFLIVHSGPAMPDPNAPLRTSDSVVGDPENDDPLLIQDFLAMELMLGAFDTYLNPIGMPQDYVSHLGDSGASQHPEMAVFYDSTGYYYQNSDMDFVAGMEVELSDSSDIIQSIEAGKLFAGKNAPEWASEVELKKYNLV